MSYDIAAINRSQHHVVATSLSLSQTQPARPPTVPPRAVAED